MSDFPRIFCLTSDRYLPALRPFAWLMNKYWLPNPEVVVGGFTPPDFALPPNFTFHSIGKYEDYPFNRWSDALHDFLVAMPDELVILLLEDYWIVRQVNTQAIQYAYDYMRQFQYVIKFDICTDRLYAMGMKDYGYAGYLDVIISMPGSPYHASLWPGIWRKQHLLKHLVPEESPHDFELQGTTRLSHDRDVIVVGSRQYPLRITLGIRGGNAGAIDTSGLDPTDEREMRLRSLL